MLWAAGAQWLSTERATQGVTQTQSIQFNIHTESSCGRTSQHRQAFPLLLRPLPPFHCALPLFILFVRWLELSWFNFAKHHAAAWVDFQVVSGSRTSGHATQIAIAQACVVLFLRSA